MDSIASPRSVKKAAIVSQIILVIWAILLLLSSLFQNTIIAALSGRQMQEFSEKIILCSGIFMCMAGAVITLSNVLILKEKEYSCPLSFRRSQQGCFLWRFSLQIPFRQDLQP